MAAAPVGEGRTLRGQSGVLHTFSGVIRSPGLQKVVETFGREVTEVDIIGLYAKMIDVGVRCAEVVGPSWTVRTQELAKMYGIELKEAA